MNDFHEKYVDCAGAATRVFVRGNSGEPATLLLHGSVPGVTPYCGGAHIWGDDCLARFKGWMLIVPDLPGSGATLPGAAPLTVEVIGQNVMALLASLSIDSVDVIGHDFGGLIGIWLALQHASHFRTLSVVASPMSPPTADGLDPILLTPVPKPLWTRESQEWTLERLSFVHTHISDDLLDRCVTAGLGEAHRLAAANMRHNYDKSFVPSMTRLKSRLWEACRHDGVSVPTQVVWGSHDPSTSIESGRVLFDAIAARQKAAHMHVLNRAGHFVFREQTEAFHYTITSFSDGIATQSAGGNSIIIR